MKRLTFWAARFRACRLFLPPHCHVNGLCPLIPAEWESMRNTGSTYTLWLELLANVRLPVARAEVPIDVRETPLPLFWSWE